MTSTQSTTTRHTAAQTILRVVLGVIFLAHGWQKVFDYTLAGTTASFEGMGIPAASLAAPVVAILELVGGIALILGLFTRPLAILFVLDMLGALFLVHLSAGIFAGDGGYELVLILAAASASLALTGAGKWSLDRILFAGRGKAAVLV